MNKIFYPHDHVFINGALSVSQIERYCKCRKAWKYHYLDGIRRKRTAPYLVLGKLVHEGIAEILCNRYKPQEKAYELGYEKVSQSTHDYLTASLEYIDTLDRLQQEQFALETYNIEANAKRIVKRLMDHFDLSKWHVCQCNGTPMIEAHFGVPITKNYYMHGFIDLIAEEKESGQVWLIDWKVRKSLTPAEDEAYNMQNAIYCYALKYSKIPITGSITYQTLSSPITIPRLNKNGSVSTAKIRCTWQDYAEFCVANGQDPSMYMEEMKPKLEEIEWIKPIKEYRSEFIMNNIWNNVVKGIASEIYSKRKNKKYPPALNPMNCKFCEYAVLCQHEIRGYDAEFVMKEEYFHVDTHEYMREREGVDIDTDAGEAQQ